jgi:soluble lytic murein transglycosylase
MAAALGEEYTFRIDKAPANANPALTRGQKWRVRELMYWNMDNTARSEWANLVTSRTTDESAACPLCV